MTIVRLLTRPALFAALALSTLAFMPSAVATDNHDDGDGKLCNGSYNDLYVKSHKYQVGTTQTSSPPANLPPGTVIDVLFKVARCNTHGSGTIKLSFVSYDATTNLNLADQTVFDSDHGYFGPGYGKLSITVPSCSYQLDFVYGSVITDFLPATYHGQDRFISGATKSRACVPEPSKTVTTPSVQEAKVGEAVTDHAHVSSADGDDGNLAGSVKFYVCAVDVVPCTTGGTLLGTVPLDGDYNATSPPFSPGAPGTYCFRGEFSGNAKYLPSTDSSRSECFSVSVEIPFFPTLGSLALGIVGALGAVALMLRRRQA
jgi:hypothetical protein